jgi:hypothetical protein
MNVRSSPHKTRSNAFRLCRTINASESSVGQFDSSYSERAQKVGDFTLRFRGLRQIPRALQDAALGANGSLKFAVDDGVARLFSITRTETVEDAIRAATEPLPGVRAASENLSPRRPGYEVQSWSSHRPGRV